MNVLIHLGTALLVFELLRMLLRKNWPACIGALLFALHPLQVETVAWASGTNATARRADAPLTKRALPSFNRCSASLDVIVSSVWVTSLEDGGVQYNEIRPKSQIGGSDA